MSEDSEDPMSTGNEEMRADPVETRGPEREAAWKAVSADPHLGAVWRGPFFRNGFDAGWRAAMAAADERERALRAERDAYKALPHSSSARADAYAEGILSLPVPVEGPRHLTRAVSRCCRAWIDVKDGYRCERCGQRCERMVPVEAEPEEEN